MTVLSMSELGLLLFSMACYLVLIITIENTGLVGQKSLLYALRRSHRDLVQQALC